MLQTCVISSEHLILSSVPLHHLYNSWWLCNLFFTDKTKTISSQFSTHTGPPTNHIHCSNSHLLLLSPHWGGSIQTSPLHPTACPLDESPHTFSKQSLLHIQSTSIGNWGSSGFSSWTPPLLHIHYITGSHHTGTWFLLLMLHRWHTALSLFSTGWSNGSWLRLSPNCCYKIRSTQFPRISLHA